MPRVLTIDRRFDDRAHLHLENFRIRDAQTATAMAEHGVRFVQLLHASLNCLTRRP